MLRYLAATFTLLFVAGSGDSLVQAQDVKQSFIPQGVTKRMGGYRPLQAEMDKDADIVKKAPEGLEAPKYGLIKVGEKSWAFIVDEPEEKEATLYIDTNNDGDLTNDPETLWKPRIQGELTTYFGEGQIDLGEGNVGAIGLYRFDPKDQQRARLKNTLMFYLDFGFEYTFNLDGQEFKTFSAGAMEDGNRLSIDRDGNGQISRNYEMVVLGEPFNFTGTTYVFSLDAGKLKLDKADREVPKMDMPPDLRIGKPALEFTATTMDGTEIHFPKHYAGKLVMLDFWATWCGPCIGEIPNMKQAYSDWHDAGFEILGISFDQANAEDKVKEFLTTRELPWEQIYEGKMWDTTLGKKHDVSGIPFVLLVDGDSGTILATARELRGSGLSEFVGKQLELKKETKKSDVSE
jgi:thiol-disulfide isomerase/thioredoxin